MLGLLLLLTISCDDDGATPLENAGLGGPPPPAMSYTDEDYELVLSIHTVIGDKIRSKGWETMAPEERHFSNVMAFFGKVESGGFDGFYFDSEHLPTMIPQLRESLLAVEAGPAEAILAESMNFFDGGVVPHDLDARVDMIREKPDNFEPFGDLEDRFYAEVESHYTLLACYARRHPEVFQRDEAN